MRIHVSAASVDITPRTPTMLAGYLARTDISRRVNDPIEANILVLRGDGKLVVIVSLDLLYPGQQLREAILSLGSELRSEQLFLAASHTHFAPATSYALPHLGAVDDGYVRDCAGRVARTIASLLQTRGEPAAVLAGTSVALRSLNRRRRGWRLARTWPFLRSAVLMAPNETGPVDSEARLLHFVSTETGKSICVLWNWSCHPVGFPDKLAVSADFPGAVRGALRMKHESELPVLFLQGFAGDVRPPAARRDGRVHSRCFTHWPAREWKAWVEHISSAVTDTQLTVIGELENLEVARSELPLSRFVRNEIDGRRVAFHGVALHRIVLAGISAEPTVSYIPILRELFPADAFVLPIGCIDDTYGYLPTASELQMGGYEAGGFLSAFSLNAPLAPDIETIAVDGFRALRRELIGAPLGENQ